MTSLTPMPNGLAAANRGKTYGDGPVGIVGWPPLKCSSASAPVARVSQRVKVFREECRTIGRACETDGLWERLSAATHVVRPIGDHVEALIGLYEGALAVRDGNRAAA